MNPDVRVAVIIKRSNRRDKVLVPREPRFRVAIAYMYTVFRDLQDIITDPTNKFISFNHMTAFITYFMVNYFFANITRLRLWA